MYLSNTSSTTKTCHEGQREEVLAWLAEHVPRSRIQHILRVEQMAAKLAQHHHLNSETAAQAGLLHDLAKYFKLDRLLEMARTEGLEIDPVAQANPHLLHAEVSALVARDEFNVQDEAILQAIANHTLGRPGMNLLSCVIFLADSLESGRGNCPELEAIRQICLHDLDQAVWMTCNHKLKKLMDRRFIHPRMILTRNWALQKSKAKLLHNDS